MISVTQFSKPRTLREWYDYRSKLDFNPSYQRRGNLWSAKSKKLLINSIINGYDFPKLYFADFSFGPSVLNEKNNLYAVIDGKQRLNSIFDYFEDKMCLDDEPVEVDGTSYELNGLTYSQLRGTYPKLALLIDNYVPTVMSVVTSNYEDILQMFVRLNNNVTISGPEKRNAMLGPLPVFFRDIANHSFIKTCCSFSVSRGQDYNLAAKLMYLEANQSLVTLKKADLDKFAALGKNQLAEFYKDPYNRVEETLSKMTSFFSEKDDLLKSQTVVPIYYWLVRTLGSVSDLNSKLRRFESKRIQVKRKVSIPGHTLDATDSDFITYNSVVRSPDDKVSLEKMYDILYKNVGT